MIVTHVEVSKEKGFLLVVYKESGQAIYGIEIKPELLEEKIQQGLKYKIRLDAVFNIEEIDANEVIDAPIQINPFE